MARESDLSAALGCCWLNAKPIPPAQGSVPIMLVSDGHCVCLLMRRGSYPS